MALFKRKKEEEEELNLDLDMPPLEEAEEGPRPLPEQPPMLPRPIIPLSRPREQPLPPTSYGPKPLFQRPLRIRKDGLGPTDLEVAQLTPAKPYMYVKISKYREILEKVRKLRRTFDDLERETRELSRINAEVREKVGETQAVLDRINDVVTFFEATFVRPEE